MDMELWQALDALMRHSQIVGEGQSLEKGAIASINYHAGQANYIRSLILGHDADQVKRIAELEAQMSALDK